MSGTTAPLLAQILNENKEVASFRAAQVWDEATGKTVAAHISDLVALKTAWNTFFTGEPDDNGATDRLKELIALIQANKDSIEAITGGFVVTENIVNDLTSGGAAKVLSAEQGKVLKGLIDNIHVFANEAVLDGISKNEATGNLVYNSKELTGETGVAILANAEAQPVYNGKFCIIFDAPAAEGA